LLQKHFWEGTNKTKGDCHQCRLISFIKMCVLKRFVRYFSRSWCRKQTVALTVRPRTSDTETWASQGKGQFEPEAQKNLTVCCERLPHFCSFLQETSFTWYISVPGACTLLGLWDYQEGANPPPIVAMVMDDARSGAPGNRAASTNRRGVQRIDLGAALENRTATSRLYKMHKNTWLISYFIVQYLLTRSAFKFSASLDVTR